MRVPRFKIPLNALWMGLVGSFLPRLFLRLLLSLLWTLLLLGIGSVLLSRSAKLLPSLDQLYRNHWPHRPPPWDRIEGTLANGWTFYRLATPLPFKVEQITIHPDWSFKTPWTIDITPIADYTTRCSLQLSRVVSGSIRWSCPHWELSPPLLSALGLPLSSLGRRSMLYGHHTGTWSYGKGLSMDTNLHGTLEWRARTYQALLPITLKLLTRTVSDLLKNDLSFSLTQGTLEVPAWHVQLKRCHLEGHWTLGTPTVPFKGQFILNQNIKNPILIKGHLQMGAGPRSKTPIQVQVDLKGNHVHFDYNTSYQIVASPNVQIRHALEDRKLHLLGELLIHEGLLDHRAYDKHREDQSVPADLVVHSKRPRPPPFEFRPHLKLIAEDKVSFKGSGLTARLGGKLLWYTHPNNSQLWLGEGRLTIKEGRYRLNGRPFHIHHGRLLYPTGTLLDNPILDIRITPYATDSVKETILRREKEVGLLVQGQLQDPKITPFSNAALDQQEIYEQLGFSNPATLLLGNSSNQTMETIQSKLGLDEISLGSKKNDPLNWSTSWTDPALHPADSTTQITITKKLRPKVHVQVLSDAEGNGKARLQYELGRHSLMNLESDGDSSGADLLFYFEK